VFSTVIDSPIGVLELTSDGTALTEIRFIDDEVEPERRDLDTDPVLQQTVRQLEEYFDGERTDFDLPLSFAGTAFQKQVWSTLLEIPYAETWSYADLARRIGQPTAFRAVGAANGQNPLPVVVPCHRVVGANGSLTGYGGGLDRKRTLLQLEANIQPMLG
jgi:methylated-DNA-[protein]-cysteine S-methyltransferase